MDNFFPWLTTKKTQNYIDPSRSYHKSGLSEEWMQKRIDSSMVSREKTKKVMRVNAEKSLLIPY